MTKSRRNKKRRPIPRVKAVGISVYNPVVLVTYGTYSPDIEDNVTIYPKKGEEEFTLEESSDGHKNFVVLKAVGRALDLRPYADRIHRVIVIGSPAELSEYGIPVIDAEVKDGRIHKPLTLSGAEIQDRIENRAVTLKLKKTGIVGPPPAEEEEEPEESAPAAEDGTLLGWLLDLQDKFTGSKVEFENQVTIPTILRLIEELERSAFKTACKRLGKWGIEKDDRRAFYRFVEGIEGGGRAVGEAARSYLWPDKGAKKRSLEKLAAHHSVSHRDVKLVVLGTKKLQESLD